MSEAVVEAPATETPQAPEGAAPAPTPAAPKPTDTLEFWKQKAREQENRAKSNADKAREYDTFVESQKTEQQRQQEAAAQIARDLEAARAETTRYKVAASHRLGEDYFDLLGVGNEEEITGRAERIGGLISERDAATAEVSRLRAELEALQTGKPVPQGRPTESLRPGATPAVVPPIDDAYPADWFPQRRSNPS